MHVIIWGIIQICKIFVYISGVAWRRKVGRGPHKKKERKSCIESGVWGPPQKFFTEKGTKFCNSKGFLDTSNDIYMYQHCHSKRVDGIYVICII